MFIQDQGISSTIPKSNLSGETSISHPDPFNSAYNFTVTGGELLSNRIDKFYELDSLHDDKYHKLFLYNELINDAGPIIPELLTTYQDENSYTLAGNVRNPYSNFGPDSNSTYFNGISCDPRAWVLPVIGLDQFSLTRSDHYFRRATKPIANQNNYRGDALCVIYNTDLDDHMVVTNIILRNTVNDVILASYDPGSLGGFHGSTSLPFVVPRLFTRSIYLVVNEPTVLTMPNGNPVHFFELDSQHYSMVFISDTGISELTVILESRIAPAESDLYAFIPYKIFDGVSIPQYLWDRYYEEMNRMRDDLNLLAV